MTPTERLQWLAERQSGLGSSDAPNLVGLGFRTAQDVYIDKTEPVRDLPPAGNLRRYSSAGGMIPSAFSAGGTRGRAKATTPIPRRGMRWDSWR